jgi:hypothetical protein
VPTPEWIDPADRNAEELTGELQYKEIFTGLTDCYPGRPRVLFQNLYLYAKDSKTYVVYVKDRDLNPVDLTGAVATLTWRPTKGSSVVSLSKRTNVAGQGEIGAANKGEAFFYLVPSDTTTLESDRQYVWDIQVTLSTGKRYTVLEGVTTLRKPVA